MGDITNTTLTKVNNMIQMTFTNDSGKNIFIICNKLDINAHVERMDEKEFFWTKSEILSR
tara:strand:+ start:1141 stop:1320 length:180 start_codon:yes stop_codon:yes gene_type:complete